MIPNVTITSAAEKFMRRMVRFSGIGGEAGFRLAVSAGGCSGYSTDFRVERCAAQGEEVLVVNGLKLFMPEATCALLDGLTVDFADTPTQTGLKVFDPKGGPCGCASSSSSVLLQHLGKLGFGPLAPVRAAPSAH